MSDIATPTKSTRATGKREQTKASNRQAILDAARQVFAELGYGATTVRDIIRRTDLASGTFYNYFKSKEEVFQALMDESALRVRPRLRAERIRASTFEMFIRGTFHTFFDYVKNDTRTFAMMRANAGQMRVRMDTPEVVAGFEELHHDIVDAIDKGLAPPVDADYLAAAFIGVAFEIADHMVLRENCDVEEATEFATALFLGGLKALPRRDGGK
jgi:AcrR family transcriptional regulator